MKSLETTEIQQVAGGQMPHGVDNKPQAVFKVEASTKTPNDTTATTFRPAHPEGTRVRLKRFDAAFTAPSNSEGDDQPLFAGLNDQGGVV